jgi:hypothetical protein
VKAWEIWTGLLFGQYPVLLISAQSRIDLKKYVVVLKGVTLQPGAPFRCGLALC